MAKTSKTFRFRTCPDMKLDCKYRRVGSNLCDLSESEFDDCCPLPRNE